VTLAATVREAADRFGPRPAFVDPDGSRVSYTELHERSDEVAAVMAPILAAAA
jgi:acyl-CoA synthetase (AMP-forming)/AMP-acid ligase II